MSLYIYSYFDVELNGSNIAWLTSKRDLVIITYYKSCYMMTYNMLRHYTNLVAKTLVDQIKSNQLNSAIS